MRLLLPAILAALSGCTIVTVEGEDHEIYVESPTVSGDNGAVIGFEGGRRDPTVNIAPLTTW